MENRRVLVTGNWECLHQGNCDELEHVRADEDSVPTSILKERSQFVHFLTTSPHLVSLQLASEDKVTFDFHSELLEIIGENCTQLECLTFHFFMSDEEIQKHKEMNVDDEENNPHAKAWNTFITSVSQNFQHISFAGDYIIPLFAMKKLLTKCHKIDIIDGAFSEQCCILNSDEIPFLKDDFGENIIFITSLNDENIDLEKVIQKCPNLRMFWFNYTKNMDLNLLDSENMQHLVELQICIFEQQKESWDEDETDDIKSPVTCLETSSKTNEEVDLLLPLGSTLRQLEVSGVILSNECWKNIFERAKLLRSIRYGNNETFLDNKSLEYIGQMTRLQHLTITMKNKLTDTELIQFFMELYKHNLRKEIFITVEQNLINEEKVIIGIVEKLVEFFQSSDAKCKHEISLTLSLGFSTYEGTLDGLVHISGCVLKKSENDEFRSSSETIELVIVNPESGCSQKIILHGKQDGGNN